MYTLLDHSIAASSDTNNVTTPSINSTGADLIVYFFAQNNRFEFKQTITDNFGNSTGAYIAAATNQNEINSLEILLLFIVQNPTTTGAGHTASATGDTIRPVLGISAWSGHGSSPLDQAAAVNDANFFDGGGNVSAAGITPSENNELILAACEWDGRAAATPPTLSASPSMTLLDSAGTVFFAMGMTIYYAIQTTAAGVSGTWNMSDLTFTETCNMTVSFRAASSGGSTSLKRNSSLSGLGSSGPFFHDPLAYPLLKDERMARKHLIEQKNRFKKAA